MKKLLKINYTTITIIGFSLLTLSGCTKDSLVKNRAIINNKPTIDTKPVIKKLTKVNIKSKVKNTPIVNNKPIVEVPKDKIVDINETVELHATVSDKDKEDKLTYLWRVAAKPKASQLSLTNATKKDISFKVDKQGLYYLDFFAKNGHVRSKVKRVIITVRSLVGTWTANLSKTKEENEINESETAELVEALSSNYKLVFLENGKIKGNDNSSWSYQGDGNYQLNASQNIKLIKENELYIINKLKSGKELKFYYKKIYNK